MQKKTYTPPKIVELSPDDPRAKAFLASLVDGATKTAQQERTGAS